MRYIILKIYKANPIQNKYMESSTQANEQAILGAFKMFDRDGDGKISGAEFKAVMGSLVEKLTDADAEKMMREADKDGDNHLTYEEF